MADTLLVAPGTYAENSWVSKGVTARSAAGPEVTRILNISTPSQPQGNTVGLDHVNSVPDGFTVQGVQGMPELSPGVFLLDGATVRRGIVFGFTTGLGIEMLDGRVNHCTVVGNRYGVMGISHYGGHIAMDSSIIAHNWDVDFFRGNLGGSVSYSAGLDGDPHWLANETGNLPGDPMLHDLAQGEVHLQARSPCIDSASPSSPPDPDGSAADMGALPCDPARVPGPGTYCVGKLHSEGCVATMGFEGPPGLSESQPFWVKASNLPVRQFGLIFYGLGPREAPLFGGTRCIQLPTWRRPIVFSGGAGPCSGTFDLDFNALLQTQGHHKFIAGTAVFAQYVFRDPRRSLGHAIGLTNALEFRLVH